MPIDNLATEARKLGRLAAREAKEGGVACLGLGEIASDSSGPESLTRVVKQRVGYTDLTASVAEIATVREAWIAGARDELANA